MSLCATRGAPIDCPGMKLTKLSTFTIGLCLVLAACGTGLKARYSIHVNEQEPAKVLDLINASERVAKRKVAASGDKGTAAAVPKGGNAGELTVSLKDTSLAEKVDHFLTDPFVIDIRSLKPGAEKKQEKDRSLEDWIRTAIDTKHFQGAQLVGSKQTGEIGVELLFTPEGSTLLAKLFAKSKGKIIGIFVKDFLVSELTVNSDKPGEHFVISGIPSPTVAQVFVDDVNVGLKVTFASQN